VEGGRRGVEAGHECARGEREPRADEAPAVMVQRLFGDVVVGEVGSSANDHGASPRKALLAPLPVSTIRAIKPSTSQPLSSAAARDAALDPSSRAASPAHRSAKSLPL